MNSIISVGPLNASEHENWTKSRTYQCVSFHPCFPGGNYSYNPGSVSMSPRNYDSSLELQMLQMWSLQTAMMPQRNDAQVFNTEYLQPVELPTAPAYPLIIQGGCH